MLQPLLPTQWCNTKPILLLSTLLIAPAAPVWAEDDNLPRTIAATPYIASSRLPMQVFDTAQEMIQPETQPDPLHSSYPVPWNWVTTTYEELRDSTDAQPRYYRTPPLISPDGLYAAYSRIQMQTRSDLHSSQVSSVMFLENLKTGELKTITASSPLAANYLEEDHQQLQSGAISILIPVSWSEQGDRLLARQFEGLFSTSEASDYAVIWDRNTARTRTVAPTTIQYTNAVLLGWSSLYPQQVLFRAGSLGETEWPQWAVNLESETTLAKDDKPIVYGRFQNPVWSGPQAKW
ncbi:hypothetical protein PN462_08895 [Spirulina sp. CS-785/01]|uniref:hypothetical protein n=1 Tax=Spirulina sp. CS-785/01 TaxID=3021716 RepID=UPI00232E3077|nr:hypothetical protein [Spirulina sp. CS-785/01]MDB9313214.1 hypothetical protein [Spirulina sp. CS-785/01]